ncbi:mycofactocin precursor MftA [Phaeacidiphilus oryzae]|nr:mycofactocin precursor MftA [Phaeacidiphilus oryzae]
MNDSATLTAAQVPQSEAELEQQDAPVADLVESDDLVEEVSIDGMCGVY